MSWRRSNGERPDNPPGGSKKRIPVRQSKIGLVKTRTKEKEVDINKSAAPFFSVPVGDDFVFEVSDPSLRDMPWLTKSGCYDDSPPSNEDQLLITQTAYIEMSSTYSSSKSDRSPVSSPRYRSKRKFKVAKKAISKRSLRTARNRRRMTVAIQFAALMFMKGFNSMAANDKDQIKEEEESDDE